MLVATPGQTASYSTLHNNSANGGGSNSTSGASSMTKKPTTLNSTNGTTSGAAKSLNNNNHAPSTVSSKNSLISSTHNTTFNNHANGKNDTNVCNKLNNQNKTIATSSREINSSNKPAIKTHSLRSENSTSTTNSTTIKQQSFIQTLKDSVQKALISTTGSTSNNLIANKYLAESKLKNSCSNSTASINNVTSSSSSKSYNTNKVSTTTSSNTSNNSTAAIQSSTSMSVGRSKHFSCSLSKLHTVAPTVIHRYPEERLYTSSTDSLQKEMCHFKPIRIVPKTPWKSGSKSRGNSLRFPKANLATKKTEFILKSNCDVNNRKKKQPQNRTQNDKINVNDVEDDVEEQENKEIHGIYKPKPSLTCLSASFTTPNHQSAFVCLVAQMNLVNMQSKNLATPSRNTDSNVEEVPDESIKELFVRKRQKSAKKQHNEETLIELSKIRSTRLSSNAKNKRVSSNTTNQSIINGPAKGKNTKSDILKIPPATITKAKSRRKLGRAKSKNINLVALSSTKTKEKLQDSVSILAVAFNKSSTFATPSKSPRKRKMTLDANDDLQQQELNESFTSSPSTSAKSLSLTSRKSSRLSTRKLNATDSPFKHPTNKISQKTTVKSSQKLRNSSSVACFSPPLTRSRLKRLAELGKIVTNATADNKKRKI